MTQDRSLLCDVAVFQVLLHVMAYLTDYIVHGEYVSYGGDPWKNVLVSL